MRREIFAVLIVGLLIFGIAFAAAENNASLNESNKTVKNVTKKLNESERKEVVKEIKNATRTFGACVSDGAKEKNVCFKVTKNKLKTCKEGNETSQCRADYNKEMKQCKTDFKGKKNECKKIKHNFFETLRHSFD